MPTLSHDPRYVLSIAGFDPSGGAGISADLKVFDHLGALGLGALSCLTEQTENQFFRVCWEPLDSTISTIEMLGKRYPISAAKIGLAKDFSTIIRYIEAIRRATNPGIPIVVDPISAPTASEHPTDFLQSDREAAKSLLAPQIILTPNLPEAELYFGQETLLPSLCQSTGATIVLKGGHGENSDIVDRLYTSDGECQILKHPRAQGTKHGTGCIFSAVITASLALGCAMPKAIVRAQQYLYHYVNSHRGGLGLHGDRAHQGQN